MTSATATSIALLGGPESGKTTYMGALADAIQVGAAGLRVAQAAADSRGFLRLMQPLQRGEYPQRTKEERHRFVADLSAAAHDGSLKRLTLEAGDYDGEEVERLFTRQGALTDEWQARAQAQGILLFLRHDFTSPLPKDARPAPSEADRWAAVAGVSTAESPEGRISEDPKIRLGYGLSSDDMVAPPAQPKERVKVPTALALIEVLQFLRHVRGLDPGERPPRGDMRVAVLLSAWDAVDTSFRNAGPLRYLTHELPLLHDFLWSNYHEEDFCCFGLSSTGGDLRNEDYREKYLDEPDGLVSWSDPAGRVHNVKELTLPIRWALFGDRVLPIHD